MSSASLTSRVNRPRIALVIACALSFGFLIFLARDLTFFSDDWWFIDLRQDWTISAFMAPHNGHWVLTVALAWKPLLEFVGLRSFLPYIALTLLAHVVAAVGVYRVCSYLARRWAGVAAAALLLFAGYASEVFSQANVVNHVAATACGVWAVDLYLRNASRRRLVIAATLLTVGVASAESALFFVAAIGACCLLYPSRRRQIWIVAPAVIAYATWLVFFGSGSPATTHGATVIGIVEYVLVGIAATVGANIGLSSSLVESLGVGGVLIAAVAAFAVALLFVVALIDLFRHRNVPIAVSLALFGLIAEYVIIGLARYGQYGLGNALTPPYAYIGSTFLFIGLAGWLGPRVAQMSLTPRRLTVLRIAGAAVALFLVVDVIRLASANVTWQQRSNDTRAVVEVFLQPIGTPGVSPDRYAPPLPDDSFVSAVPPPKRLDRLVARFGSPLADVTTDPRVPAATLQRVRDSIAAADVGAN